MRKKENQGNTWNKNVDVEQKKDKKNEALYEFNEKCQNLKTFCRLWRFTDRPRHKENWKL